MFVEAGQGDLDLAKPAERRSARRVPPLRPPVLLLHVPQHRELVQVPQVRALWTGHLFGHLVDHPEHPVLVDGVHLSMALEVGDGDGVPTDLAQPLPHTLTLVVSLQVADQSSDPLNLSTVVEGASPC